MDLFSKGIPTPACGRQAAGAKSMQVPCLQQLLSQLLQGGGASGEEIPLNIFCFHDSGAPLPPKSPPLSNSAWYFPGDPVVKNVPSNAGDAGSLLGLGGFHMPQSN